MTSKRLKWDIFALRVCMRYHQQMIIWVCCCSYEDTCPGIRPRILSWTSAVTVDISACRDSRADIAFVLDASGSIVQDTQHSPRDLTNWNLMKAFVITLLRSLKVSQNETRVALVRFSINASVIFQLNSYSTAEHAVQVTFTLVGLIDEINKWHWSIKSINDTV